ncbi:MAG TPA: hypothetical protein VGK55_12360 [Actinomycetes bacterium]
MATSEITDFGRCSCSGEISLRWVEVQFSRPAGEPAMLGNVPQGRCEVCGSRYYRASTLQWIELAFRATHR